MPSGIHFHHLSDSISNGSMAHAQEKIASNSCECHALIHRRNKNRMEATLDQITVDGHEWNHVQSHLIKSDRIKLHQTASNQT